MSRTAKQCSALLLAVSLHGAAGHAAQGNPARGGMLFLQCRACHAIVAGAPAGVGPNLRGVVGAKAGSRPGYSYSAALAASGIVWNPQTLDAWLTRPTALVPGTKMAFQGISDQKMRADVIAYLGAIKE